MKLQDKLKNIKNENSIIKLAGTGLGAGIGLGIDYLTNNNNPVTSFGLGGLAGNLIFNNLVSDRINNYISGIIFGPYVELSIELHNNTQELILAICNFHRDFSYSTKLSSNINNIEKCLLNTIETEKDVRYTRNCFLKFYKSNNDIFENYCKEKRANIKFVKFFKHTYSPIYMTIKKYLEDSSIVIESDLLYNIGNLIYVSEGFFSKSKSKTSTKTAPIDLSRRNFLRGAGTVAAAYALPKAIEAIDPVAKGLNQIVSDAQKTHSNYNKMSKIVGNEPYDLQNPSKRVFMASFLPNEQGHRTFNRLVKTTKYAATNGVPALVNMI